MTATVGRVLVCLFAILGLPGLRAAAETPTAGNSPDITVTGTGVPQGLSSVLP